MKSIRLPGIAVAVAVLFLAACTPKVTPPPPPPFNTDIPLKEVMDHVMDPSADAFWSGTGVVLTIEGAKDLTPKTDVEWKHVEDGAASVVIATNALLLPGYARQPAADWNRYAKAVADLAARGKDAADRKDKEAVATIGDQLDQACENCHLKFAYPPGGKKP